ncbi:MAG: hypothetical protein ACKOLA_07445, partial [Spartobacteria bacterium]
MYYHSLFSDIREAVDSVFEFGIGSTRPEIRHNMGASGKPGASLRGWRDYFPNANIYAADIDKGILEPDYRIFKFFCDQTDETSIDALWRMPELEGRTFDIMIEDGLHVFEAQLLFMKKSLHKVRRGGYYICEDIPDADFEKWRTALRSLAGEHTGKSFELDKIDDPKNEPFSLVVVKEPEAPRLY